MAADSGQLVEVRLLSAQGPRGGFRHKANARDVPPRSLLFQVYMATTLVANSTLQMHSLT